MASETVCDIVESYFHKCVGTLPENPFEGSTISELLGLENASIWGTNECNEFLTLLDNGMDIVSLLLPYSVRNST